MGCVLRKLVRFRRIADGGLEANLLGNFCEFTKMAILTSFDNIFRSVKNCVLTIRKFLEPF